ncbi:MAG TPA: flagellar filament capping protein FliD [Defluviitaleaceae bacterium]|jgi:flagellar hook-associated protein 2|nr:flagellar filament capping protein FliD [Candidatus Epulonipiscium sp.]HOA79557.1 flagellar filament capping protein FliD [Defluviitaleaceae bacterium]
MLITNDRLRLTGISGLDTNTLVESLMKAELTKVDKMKQQLQILKWQQEGYREMINVLRGFKDDYLDVLSSKNLITENNFRIYGATAKINGIDTDAVKVEATGTASVGSHSIIVKQLAKNEIWESISSVSGEMLGSEINWDNLKKGKTIDVTLDGVKKTIKLSQDHSTLRDIDALTADLQTQLDNAFGSDNINVSNNGGKIKFVAEGHSFKLSDSVNTYVSSLGFRNNQANSITGGKLTVPLDLSNGSFKVTVNGTEKTITLSESAVYEEDSLDLLAADLKSAINAAFDDTELVDVRIEDNRLKIVSYNTSDEIMLSNGETNNVLSKLGFNNNIKITKLEAAADISISEIGKEFDIYIDGVKNTIEITEEINSVEDLANVINSQVSGITVTADGDKLVFSETNGKEVRISNSQPQTLKGLGFENGDTNILDLDSSLSKAFGITEDTTVEINGVSFTFKSTDTVKSMMSKINNSNAGVTLSYSSVKDKFVLQSDNEGAANKIKIDPLDNILFDKMFNPNGLTQSYVIQEAADAEIVLDGVATKRGSNSFEVDGLKYTLNRATGDEKVDIKVSPEPEKLVERVKDFVNAYNEMISKISSKVNENRAKSGKYEYYQPLTDEQKKEMSEKDIELWEEAAKSGLLRNDSTLQNILYSMRRALYDGVEGVGIRIFDLGITTSKEYTDNGKLVLDEEKLRKAIEERPDEVAELFTKKSTIPYTSEDRKTRYNENGLSSRLLDIINDNIRTNVNSKGYRGILIEKAGIENTVSATNNAISKQIERQSKEIEEMLDRLTEKENNYFLMFSRLESMIQKLNTQSAFLTNITSGGWQ